jgi:hypothetical protein
MYPHVEQFETKARRFALEARDGRRPRRTWQRPTLRRLRGGLMQQRPAPASQQAPVALQLPSTRRL